MDLTTNENDNKPGFKYDEGKPKMGLLDPHAMREIAKVMTYGAGKYSTLNWRRGMDWSRCYDALQRHLNAFWAGEDDDPETGLSHLAHAGCCIMFLLWYTENRRENDDRFSTILFKEGRAEAEKKNPMIGVTFKDGKAILVNADDAKDSEPLFPSGNINLGWDRREEGDLSGFFARELLKPREVNITVRGVISKEGEKGN